MTTVWAPRLLRQGRLHGPGGIEIDAGRIVGLREGAPEAAAGDVVLTDGLLTAGMVDVQLNGCYGVDLSQARPEQWREVRERLPRTGVTSFCPTFITAPVPELIEAVRRAARAAQDPLPATGARVLGVHLEGPFLSPRRPGAHGVADMTDPTPEHLDELLTDGLPEHLAVVTLAPERPHAIEAIRRLVAAGVVVSLGHSDATAAETRAAVEAGASLVTHIFNAQRAVDRREPGLPGVALVEPRLALGLIADHHHLAPEIVQLVFLAGNGRVVLVTDAVAAAGMPAGRYQLGGTATYVHPEDRVPRREDGTLAGSSLSLDEAVRTVVGLGVEPAVALEAATRVPADVLGDHERGRLEPGSLADLVWWSDDLTVRRTWVGGEVAWSA